MEDYIKISYLNDFIFCPISIYFHNLYEEVDKNVYYSTDQTKGSYAHKSIDTGKYSNKKSILQGTAVYSNNYGLCGKIDLYDEEKKELTEKKKKVNKIYDGFIFQLYAQYFCLIEMGYLVKSMRIYSLDDNKIYKIKLPSENISMYVKFVKLIMSINDFNINEYEQINSEKCAHCIYSNVCDRALL